MNYLNVIERYHEYKGAIHELMASIVTGIFDHKVIKSEESLKDAMRWLQSNYPFVDLVYTLDAKGVQTTNNVTFRHNNEKNTRSGKGVDRKCFPLNV